MARRTTIPFLIVAAALFVLLAASNMATPLYPVYRARFGFSSAVLTLIFATYAVVLVPSLLLFGQLSDRVGRRRVIAGGLVVSMLGLVLFAAARGTAWLFAARAVQGLAVAAISGAATAGLVELEPRGDRRRAALLSVLGQAGGCAAGPLIAGMLAQWAPDPRVLCYVVAIVLTGATALAMLTVPDPTRSEGRWRIQRPSVPPDIRVDFTRASVTGAAVWAVAALFLSVVPSYAARLLDTSNLALFGALGATMLATSCAAQMAGSGRIAPERAQPAGLAALACGLAALVAAFPLHSLAALLAAALLTGTGHGLAFLGAQTEINRLAPAERRGEVTAAFFSAIYGGVAISVIGVGIVASSVSLYTAVGVFAAAIGATATVTAAWHVAAVRRDTRAVSA